jgi:PBP1b-binding outer membrane lipoprotein LpoB
MKRILLVFIWIAIFLGGCVHPARSPVTALTPVLPLETNPQDGLESEPAAGGDLPLDALDSAPSSILATPIAPDDTLRLSFPTPAPAPVSHWTI